MVRSRQIFGGADKLSGNSVIYCKKYLSQKISLRNRLYRNYLFAITDVSNRDRLVSFKGLGSCIISFRLDIVSGRLKILFLRLRETVIINIKLYIIKRYALLYSSDYL